MARLGVKVDQIAVVRERGNGKLPDPVAAAVFVEQAGADGVVCHLREDRKYIKEKDVYLLKEIVKTHYNLQIAPTEEMIKIALEVVPDMVTLVPERWLNDHSDTSLDINTHADYLKDVIDMLRTQNLAINVLIEPAIHQIKAAAKLKVDFIELYTGVYAKSQDYNEIMDEVERIRAVAMGASKLGQGVSASVGLNYQNVSDIARITAIEEINIGHAIISKAVMVGMERAVRDMLDLVR
ncbi:MAG: pyridoxine 5'-phosphate synthase [bacterium]